MSTAITEPDSADTDGKPTAPKGKRNWAILVALLAFLFSLPALVISLWFNFPELLSAAENMRAPGQHRPVDERGLNRLEARIAAIEAIPAPVIPDDTEQLARLEQLTADHSRRLTAMRQLIQSVTNADRSQWLLAQSQYFMRIANQQALISKDYADAAKTLEMTDKLLGEVGDAKLLPIRSQIAKEKAALLSVVAIDTEALYLNIQGLSDVALSLEAFSSPRMPEPETTEERARTGWQAVKDTFGEYFRLRKNDKTQQPLLTEQEEASLRYNLQLMFEQAKLAVLSGQPALYQGSMTRASQWVEKYFSVDDRAERVAAQIAALGDQQITADAPDVGQAHRMLKQYIDERYWNSASEGLKASEALEENAAGDNAAESFGAAPQ